MTYEEMTTLYEALSAAHAYLLGFVHAKRLYVVTLTYQQLLTYCKLDRASSSRGGFAKVRVRLSKEQRAALVWNAELLGGCELLTEDPAHNKGENLERVLTERLMGKTWVKDSTPFWVAGDLRVNGRELQVKLDNAELTNEKVLRRAMVECA